MSEKRFNRKRKMMLTPNKRRIEICENKMKLKRKSQNRSVNKAFNTFTSPNESINSPLKGYEKSESIMNPEES